MGVSHQHRILYLLAGAALPGAVARTSAFALNNATLPFVLRLADLGAVKALRIDPYLRSGLNIHAGKLTYQAVAEAQNRDYTPAEDALGS